MNFQAVLIGLPDAVIAVDDALRIVFWNAAAEELTERSARRMEGRVLKEVFPPDASLVRRLSETLSMGISRSETETHIERPDHRSLPVSIVTAPLFDRAGRVEAAVAVVRDLSRIRQLEASVSVTQKRAVRYCSSRSPQLTPVSAGTGAQRPCI